MQFSEVQHNHEEGSQIAIDRAAAASKSTWTSVVVSIFLTVAQIALVGNEFLVFKARESL
jgi:uncharacterized protein (DUF1778 family)